MNSVYASALYLSQFVACFNKSVLVTDFASRIFAKTTVLGFSMTVVGNRVQILKVDRSLFPLLVQISLHLFAQGSLAS